MKRVCHYIIHSFITCSAILVFSAGLIFAESPKTTVAYFPNSVVDIEDDGEFLWLSSDCGLVKFHKATGERTYFTEENSDIPLDNTRAVAFVGDDIWVGTNGGGIGIYNGSSWDSLTASNAGLENDFVWDVLTTENDGVWIADGHWACHYEDSTWESYEVFESIYSWKLLSIAQDHQDRIWLGTSHGVYTIQDDLPVLYDAVPVSSTYFFTVGQDSTLWFGVGGYGVYALHNDALVNYNTGNSGIPFDGVLGLDIDPSGNLWVSGEGLAVFDGEHWQGYTTDDCAALQAVGPVYCDDDGIVWIGTNTNGLIRFDGETWTQYDIIPGATSVASDDAPQEFTLLNAYPNPFNPQTTITYTLSEASQATLSVFNVSGQNVATLVDGYLPAGSHNAVFDGSGLSSGMYFYRCEAAGAVMTGKMVLMK